MKTFAEFKTPLVRELHERIQAENLGTAFDEELCKLDTHVGELEEHNERLLRLLGAARDVIANVRRALGGGVPHG